VPSRAQKAQSVERRTRRFFDNKRVDVSALYLPLVLAALSGWQSSPVSGVRHHRVVESLLHDSSIGGQLWSEPLPLAREC